MTCTKAKLFWKMTGINIMVKIYSALLQNFRTRQINVLAGVGEFVDTTERMEDLKLENGNNEDDPKSSLQPGTFTDDK